MKRKSRPTPKILTPGKPTPPAESQRSTPIEKPDPNPLFTRRKLLTLDCEKYETLKAIVELFASSEGVAPMPCGNFAQMTCHRGISLMDMFEATAVGDGEIGPLTDSSKCGSALDMLRLQLEIDRAISEALFERCKRDLERQERAISSPEAA